MLIKIDWKVKIEKGKKHDNKNPFNPNQKIFMYNCSVYKLKKMFNELWLYPLFTKRVFRDS